MTLQDVLMEQVALLAKENRKEAESYKIRENAETILRIAQCIGYDTKIPLDKVVIV